MGRGGKRGSYSGRGMKGQTARAGHRYKPIMRELIKRYPKLRGYRQKYRTKSSKVGTAILNLDILEKKFNSGEEITPEKLLEKGIIAKMKGRMPRVKILGKGKINKSLIIKNCLFSKSAKERIEKAGGKIQ